MIEIATSDIGKATFFQYNGLPCVKVEGLGGQPTNWTFEVQDFDAPIIEEEFSDSKTSIYLRQWLDSLRHVENFRTKARAQMGVWTARSYSQ